MERALITQSPSLALEIKNHLSAETLIKVSSWLYGSDLSKETRGIYVPIILDFLLFLPNHFSLKEMTSDHIVRYLRKFDDLDASTWNVRKSCISSFFRYLESSGFIPYNPASAIKSKKVDTGLGARIMYLDQLEQMILKEPNPRNKLMIELNYHGGLRATELVELQVKSFRKAENGEGYIDVLGKGGKTKAVRIGRNIFTKLMAYIQENNLVFEDFLFRTKKSLKPMTRQMYFLIIKEAAERANVHPLPSPHWIRHLTASEMRRGGATLEEIMITLRHESITTTQKYGEALPQKASDQFLRPIDVK